MEFKIATLSDINTLTDLRIEMLEEDNHLTEEQKSLIQANTLLFLTEGMTQHSLLSWIALNGSSIVGMGCINFFSFPPNDWCPNGKTAYIGNVYTCPENRKRGIASTIVSHLINEAKTRECQRILLNTTDSGRPLYQEHGFADSPTAMAYYPFGTL